MSAAELFPGLVLVVCECGRIYFEGQSDALWACARRHVEQRRQLAQAQEHMRELMAAPVPRR